MLLTGIIAVTGQGAAFVHGLALDVAGLYFHLASPYHAVSSQ